VPARAPAPFEEIRLVALDVDGVMTDGRIVVHDDGSEAKFFHVHDGSAVWLLRRAGIETAIISGRRAACVDARARDLGIQICVQGAQDKVAALAEVCGKTGLEPRQCAYMGDDVLDVPIMRSVGFAAAPADARPEAKAAAALVTTARGGHGAVRELAEAILRGRGAWDTLLSKQYGI
jgi:3-deoxy-D-manno-octulosonate 8-phosphate phosphatase (KDO 8-P phosphatase)